MWSLTIAVLAALSVIGFAHAGEHCHGHADAGSAAAQSIQHPPGETTCAEQQGARQAAARRLIEMQTFYSLPPRHREVVADKLAALGERVPMPPRQMCGPFDPRARGRDVPLTDEEFQAAWQKVARFTTLEAFQRFSAIHQRMLAEAATMVEKRPIMGMACFHPDVDPEFRMAFEAIISYGLSDLSPIQFEQIGRWNSTALDPSGGGQGEPTTLTYSFPPDGTFIPSGVGEGGGSNDLNSFLDSIYGDRATWRAIYDQIFARWGELCGNTYVLEPNDDGTALTFNGSIPNPPSTGDPGIAGVRGDLRMTGKFIDGNGGTLAYNFFPQSGDMVIDTGDSAYFNLSGNSLTLRNILAHEHGHGMGQLHTCPVTNSKLMEPFINLNFDGPQLDDILNAQRHYGDQLEPSDSPAEAFDLGAFGIDGTAVVNQVSIDDDLDVDYYLVTLTEDVELSVTVNPLGFLYQAGPQTQQCTESQPYDPSVFLDPGIRLFAADGVTLLQETDDLAAGQTEVLVRDVPAGDYYIEVFGTNPNGDQIIGYDLGVTVDLPGFINATITPVMPLPLTLTPGSPTIIEATIQANSDTIIGDPVLRYRVTGDASFVEVPFLPVGGDVFTAGVPALFCGDDPEIELVLNTQVEGLITFPSGGPAQTVVGSGVFINDNAETDIGWTVTGNANEGQWERGIPQNNGRDDPPADFDGSGQAWLTGQEPTDTNSDVDGGATILTSPAYDFTNGGLISYAYWAQDTVNTIGPEDGFTVEYSTDGGLNWTEIRSYTTAGIWRTDTVDVTSEIGTPAMLQIRFIAADNDPGDVLECGVDAVVFDSFVCVDPPCAADLNGDFDTEIGDFEVFFSVLGTADAAADFDSNGVVDLRDFAFLQVDFGCDRQGPIATD